MRTVASCVVVVTLLAASARAQHAGESRSVWHLWQEHQTQRGNNAYTIQVEPTMWYTAPSGRVDAPHGPLGDGGRIDIAELNLDSPRASPSGELHYRVGPWRVGASVVQLDMDDRGAIVAADDAVGEAIFLAGDRLVSSLRLFTGQAEVGHRVWEARFKRSGEEYLAVGVEAVGGVRLYDVSFSVDVERNQPIVLPGIVGPSVSTDSNELFAEAYVGVRADLEIADTFSIDFTTGFGANPGLLGQEVWSWDIMVGFQYRPFENVAVQGGYRQLAFGLETGEDDDEFGWRGALAGVYLGVVIRY